MVAYETKTAADGCAVSKDFTLCCLLNDDLTGSFVVSGSCVEQSISIRSSISHAAESTCNISARPIEEGDVFSIQSNHKTERTVSVKGCGSKSYVISKTISNLVSITIDAVQKKLHKLCRHIHRILKNMKGRQNRQMVYTLRLLRL